jgi:hypothetical protein
MTTNRTAIRRGLAIRRPSNRPPRRGRKPEHGSIVAPLAATVAATLAATALVRAGAALARSERDRRLRAHRKRERTFALLAGESPAEGLRRIALGQVEVALAHLERGIDGPEPARAVHETRKALKRLRALMRLLRDELPDGAFARESTVLRDAGRRLAVAREGEVMVGTLEALLERNPKKLGRRRSLKALRDQLVDERNRATSRLLEDVAARAEVIRELRAMRSRVLQWELRDAPGMELAAAGLLRIYKQGRERFERAASGKGDRARAMHEWRKRVKDLRHAAEMLERADPDGSLHLPGPRRRRKQRRGRGATGRIHRLAARADSLGEALGEDHDLAVFAERIRSDRRLVLGRGPRRALLKAVRRRRRVLRRGALRAGERIYRRRPKAFVARIRDDYARRERQLRRR